MPRRLPAVHLAALSLDPGASAPLYRQLYLSIREAILTGRLVPGQRLPATRSLARDLGLSRNTVVAAFEQLAAEGYVEGRRGAGSFVSATLPEELLNARVAARRGRGIRARRRGPSRRGIFLAGIRTGTAVRLRAFSPGLPELAAFPFEDWARLLARSWRRPPRDFLVGNDPAGFRPLREALAAYLGAARGVVCTAEQVIIVSGAQQALDLAARVLIDPGDPVWVEEPGYPGMRGALLAAGAALVPVPVDAEGLDVAAGAARAPAARLVSVSPSHQYPLGVTMSLARRLELLAWARSADAFVLEDDYDSEYRYAGRPLAALQGLDDEGRVIYVGTMSKVMFPGLRIGYIVVPDDLVDAFRAVRVLIDTHPSSIAQAALADFIAEGYLSAHIRRMRTLYAERQARLVAAVRRRLDGLIAVAPDAAGMHLVGALPAEADDAAIARRAAAEGVVAAPLSAFYHGPPARRGLLLGYAGLTPREIEDGVERLRRALLSR